MWLVCELLRDVVWALFWSCVFVCGICLRVLCVMYRVVLSELLALRGCVVLVCSLNGFACFVSDSSCDGVFCLCVGVCVVVCFVGDLLCDGGWRVCCLFYCVSVRLCCLCVCVLCV